MLTAAGQTDNVILGTSGGSMAVIHGFSARITAVIFGTFAVATCRWPGDTRCLRGNILDKVCKEENEKY